MISVVSCEQVVDSYFENHENDNYVSPSQGTYMGSFSGDDNGSLKIEISKKDNVTITRHSASSNADDIFLDALSGTNFNGNASPTTGFRLSGNLVAQNKIYSGNWTVQKQ